MCMSWHEQCGLDICACWSSMMNPNISKLSSLILKDCCAWCCVLFKERKRNWFNNLSHYTTQEEIEKKKHSGTLSGKKNIVTALQRNPCVGTGGNHGDAWGWGGDVLLPWNSWTWTTTRQSSTSKKLLLSCARRVRKWKVQLFQSKEMESSIVP